MGKNEQEEMSDNKTKEEERFVSRVVTLRFSFERALL